MTEVFFYLTTTGRNSGQPHKIEIWFVVHEGCYYLCSERYEQADWVQNIQQQSAVEYYLAAGKTVVPETVQTGHARILDADNPIVAAVRRLFQQKYNWNTGLFVAICPHE